MPEKIPGTNMWKMFDDEYVVGADGTVMVGPQIVRVQEFPDIVAISVQGVIGTQSRLIEINILDFGLAVQTR